MPTATPYASGHAPRTYVEPRELRDTPPLCPPPNIASFPRILKRFQDEIAAGHYRGAVGVLEGEYVRATLDDVGVLDPEHPEVLAALQATMKAAVVDMPGAKANLGQHFSNAAGAWW